MTARASLREAGRGQIPSEASSSGVSENKFEEASGGSSAFDSMPSRPAASTRAKARYGLQAGSGARYSIRADSARPRFAIGTLTRAERLLYAHETWTGAS